MNCDWTKLIRYEVHIGEKKTRKAREREREEGDTETGELCAVQRATT